MGERYTLGRWQVKEGREDEFRAAWQAFAEWTAANVPGAVAGEAKLLQDIDDSRVFYSVGPWESIEAIAAWRATAGFQERVAGMRELLDDFEPHTLRLVVRR